MFCSVHGSCTSVNYKTSGIGKGLCELNNENVREISKAENKTRDLAELTHLKIIKKVINYIKCHIFCTFVNNNNKFLGYSFLTRMGFSGKCRAIDFFRSLSFELQ